MCQGHINDFYPEDGGDIIYETLVATYKSTQRHNQETRSI
jgi:hypothetical protein